MFFKRLTNTIIREQQRYEWRRFAVIWLYSMHGATGTIEKDTRSFLQSQREQWNIYTILFVGNYSVITIFT
jgi:hypothetical protein